MLKKLLSKLVAMSLVLTFVFAGTNELTAKAEDSQTVIVDLSEEEIDRLEQQQLDALMASFQTTRADSYEYDYRSAGSVTSTKVGIGYAGNQPSSGTVFSSKGGFYWQDGGNNTTVNISISFGKFSVNVSRGKVATTGNWITSPYLNTPVKLYIHKDIRTTKYNVYRRKKYSGGSWQLYTTSYSHTPTRNYLTVKKV